MNSPITLDGRKFSRGIDNLSLQIRTTTFSGTSEKPEPSTSSAISMATTRTIEQRAEDLLTQILLSGSTHQILAGCLTEEGKVWSRAEADANAARFAEITDFAEKIEMRKSIVTFVVGFFGAAAPETSHKSANEDEPAPGSPQAGS